MELSEALLRIKRNIGSKTISSRHFQQQLSERRISTLALKDTLARSHILGIVEQGQDLYKIWYYYDRNKDLNIILKILDDEYLLLVTVFTCNSERRKR